MHNFRRNRATAPIRNAGKTHASKLPRKDKKLRKRYVTAVRLLVAAGNMLRFQIDHPEHAARLLCLTQEESVRLDIHIGWKVRREAAGAFHPTLRLALGEHPPEELYSEKLSTDIADTVGEIMEMTQDETVASKTTVTPDMISAASTALTRRKAAVLVQIAGGRQYSRVQGKSVWAAVDAPDDSKQNTSTTTLKALESLGLIERDTVHVNMYTWRATPLGHAVVVARTQP